MKKTFAQVADMLGKKQAKFEDRLEIASDSIARNSAKRMLSRIEDSKNRLFESQEALKVPSMGDGSFQFGMGGETEPPTTEAEKKYKEAYDFHAKMRQAIGTNDTELLNSTPGAKFGPYTTNDLAADLSRAQELRKAAGLGFGEDAKLTLPHLGQQIRGTFNKLAGTHYGAGGDVPQHGAGADLLKKAMSWVGDNQENIVDGISSTAETFAPFMDNAFASKTINQMQGPVDPILQKAAQINTNYNIAAPLKENRDANTVLNRSTDNLNTSGGSANNQKIAAFTKRMGVSGQLNAQKNQVENQLENQQRGINTNVENANINTMNNFNEGTRVFDNNKSVEHMNNMNNVSTDASQMFMDNKLLAMDGERIKMLAMQNPDILSNFDPGQFAFMDSFYQDLGEDGMRKIINSAGGNVHKDKYIAIYEKMFNKTYR
jgi:hypothetical protein